MDELSDFALQALGRQTPSPAPLPMALRAAVVYVLGITLVRVGGHRFLGRFGAIDILLAFILGSTLSRAINGSAPLLASLTASAVLVGLHALLAWLAFHSPRFSALAEGTPRLLVSSGQMQRDAMRRARVPEEDLRAAIREEAGIDDLAEVGAARLETSGRLSVVRAARTGTGLTVD